MYERELIGLSKAGARYLVVGAVALSLHEYPRVTFDLDILPDLTSKNLDKIIRTLSSMGYKPRVPVDPNELKDPKKRELWRTEKHMKVFTFIDPRDPRNTVDLLIYHSLKYGECFRRRKIVTLHGTDIYVASARDLLRLKKDAMRVKDLEDIVILERILKMEKK